MQIRQRSLYSIEENAFGMGRLRAFFQRFGSILLLRKNSMLQIWQDRRTIKIQHLDSKKITSRSVTFNLHKHFCGAKRLLLQQKRRNYYTIVNWDKMISTDRRIRKIAINYIEIFQWRRNRA